VYFDFVIALSLSAMTCEWAWMLMILFVLQLVCQMLQALYTSQRRQGNFLSPWTSFPGKLRRLLPTPYPSDEDGICLQEA